jgi:hypothetical protein
MLCKSESVFQTRTRLEALKARQRLVTTIGNYDVFLLFHTETQGRSRSPCERCTICLDSKEVPLHFSAIVCPVGRTSLLRRLRFGNGESYSWKGKKTINKTTCKERGRTTRILRTPLNLKPKSDFFLALPALLLPSFTYESGPYQKMSNSRHTSGEIVVPM